VDAAELAEYDGGVEGAEGYGVVGAEADPADTNSITVYGVPVAGRWPIAGQRICAVVGLDMATGHLDGVDVPVPGRLSSPNVCCGLSADHLHVNQTASDMARPMICV
ncbi:hypothetical protein, partial [Nocardia salmonicida]|uniref:hypothetical protein n=1 Tax=Nocardia salmonicida TaxID=53431 RepID=UPI00340B1950